MSEAEKQRARYTRLVKDIEKYLKEEDAWKHAEGEPHSHVCWEDLETALDFDQLERSGILERSDEMDIDIITCPHGLYIGVCGEKARTLHWQFKHIKSRLYTIQRRFITLGKRGTIDDATRFAHVHGYHLDEFPKVLEVAGHPLPPEVIKALMPPS